MTKKQPTLVCTQEEFEALHEAVDSVRTKPTVKAPKVALEHLLRDHSALLRALS